jgi:hypothetical protein
MSEFDRNPFFNNDSKRLLPGEEVGSDGNLIITDAEAFNGGVHVKRDVRNLLLADLLKNGGNVHIDPDEGTTVSGPLDDISDPESER